MTLRTGVRVIALLCFLCTSSCEERPQKNEGRAESVESQQVEAQRPPDINGSTRIEVQFLPSALRYFYPVLAPHLILNEEEIDSLSKLDTIVCQDANALSEFSAKISWGPAWCGGKVTGRSPRMQWSIVTCYREDEKITRFEMYGKQIITDDGTMFEYPDGLPTLEPLTPQVLWFKLRAECADHSYGLFARHLRDYRTTGVGKTFRAEYPEPETWCDDLVRKAGGYGLGMRTRNVLVCPSVKESHYAMNTKCKGDSPPDTVCLFETQVGWNQHGGPELFTLDNHKPKGGCVVLNDGTVKFIRTEKELRELRWE